MTLQTPSDNADAHRQHRPHWQPVLSRSEKKALGWRLVQHTKNKDMGASKILPLTALRCKLGWMCQGVNVITSRQGMMLPRL